jgi:choline kinase
MKGLIAAAGLSTRLQDLGEQRNKVLSDLGGESILLTILSHFERAGITDTTVLVGHDGLAVRTACGTRARCLLNPFFEQHGILSSLWQARATFEGCAFVFTTGDHYFAPTRLPAFLADQPEADVLVDVDMKPCDDEDMKVFLNRAGKLRTITKTSLDGPLLGEFTGLVRLSPEGSGQLFTALEAYAWRHGLQQGYLADVLCAVHRKWELAFHLSTDHERVDVDFPCDLERARRLYAARSAGQRRSG